MLSEQMYPRFDTAAHDSNLGSVDYGSKALGRHCAVGL